MRLSTIWTMPAMTLRERLRRTSEWAWHLTARHLPRRLAYWSFIDTGARMTSTREVVPEVRFMDLAARLEHR